MFQFIGYDFCSGPDALASAPVGISKLKETVLSDGVFDHFNVTKDLNSFEDTTKPTVWDYDTILNATFDGDTTAGNLEFILGQIDGIKIKRRVKGTFDWLTLKYFPVSNIEDLTFGFNDFLNQYGVEYEYALVPMTSGVEGEYSINSIVSKFSGVFIGDAEQAFRFMYGVSYGSNARRQETGTFQPFGRQYPIVVANGVLSYESGSVSATITNDDFDETGIIDREAIVKKKTDVKNFLTNKKPKILKDWNGNLWMVMITDDVQMSYKEGTGMGLPQIQFNWIEVGDPSSQEDLYSVGLTDIDEG